MKSLICTDELATDVTGAEALIERHNEHRTEIDARTNTFQVWQKIYRYLFYRNIDILTAV
jgi:spectrin alpha